MPGFNPNQPRAILPLAAFGFIGHYAVCPPGLQFVINTNRRRDKKVDEYGNAYVRRIGPGCQPSEAIDVDELEGEEKTAEEKESRRGESSRRRGESSSRQGESSLLQRIMRDLNISGFVPELIPQPAGQSSIARNQQGGPSIWGSGLAAGSIGPSQIETIRPRDVSPLFSHVEAKVHASVKRLYSNGVSPWGDSSTPVNREVPLGFEEMGCPICQSVMSHPVMYIHKVWENDELEHKYVKLSGRS
ncbi:hypothetical protein K438DRAFT_1765324 [Mycena galopus ATCC 62051]|nr:hypothetical protein K438DRAFT_1765324 [Mycena galopus ATCC 62051]